jgi:ADP-heptose:LPS heptosyltransferase
MSSGLNFSQSRGDRIILSNLGGQSRIGVFRALQLGDMLCAIPALRALRATVPSAHITLIGLPWAASFAKRFHRYIDDFVSFPGFPGLPEQAVDLPGISNFITAMQERRFDLMVQMHGSGVLTNPLVASFGAARHAGFYLEGNFCPDPRYFMPWDETQHEIRRNLQLLGWLGMPFQGDELEFPLTEDDYAALRRSCVNLPNTGTYVCIHPGARMPTRRWHAERFAAVADRLQAAGLSVVLTGSDQEIGLARQVELAMRAKPINLCGKTDLGAFAALVAGARLVICNDTGTSHIATAVRTPSVIVNCGSDPKRWAPLDSRRHRTVLAEVACRPCMHQVCPIGHACAQQVDTDTVVHEALDLLGQSHPVIRAEPLPAHATR